MVPVLLDPALRAPRPPWPHQASIAS